MKRYIQAILATLASLIVAGPALAHVVVKPAEVGVAQFQTFTIGVPNEKDNPTVAVRLVVPEGLKHVSPNVKPGWTIQVKKEGEGEDARVTEISWTGGSIPAGQRDDFLFSAQSPGSETTLAWKAYQTYQSGDVIAWDQTPSAGGHSDKDTEPSTPYSETKVSDDVSSGHSETETNNTPLYLSLLAVLIATAALLRPTPAKK